jgi:hypothetical protein
VSYDDHISSNDDNRPSCWGNPHTFSLDDHECQGCRYQHSCRMEVVDSRRPFSPRPTVIGRTNTAGRRSRRYGEDADDGLRSNCESGIVGEGERAIERFAKDCASGALRGLFYEAWQFFRNYRF